METKDIHQQISDCAKSFKEAEDLFNKDYKYPLYRIIFKTIRDRLVELDGRNPADIQPTIYVLDEYNVDRSIEYRHFECALLFHLPYKNKENVDGVVCRKRFYNFLSSGIECGSKCLYLGRIGSVEDNEEFHTIQVREEDLCWLYGRLLKMGFFDDNLKTDFHLTFSIPAIL